MAGDGDSVEVAGGDGEVELGDGACVVGGAVVTDALVGAGELVGGAVVGGAVVVGVAVVVDGGGVVVASVVGVGVDVALSQSRQLVMPAGHEPSASFAKPMTLVPWVV